MSDFKFGIKVKPKTVGDFNVGNPEEWTLLVKPQVKDDTLFVHFHCGFKRQLTDEEKGHGVTEPPLTITITSGFLKEGCFCLVSKNNYSSHTKEKLLSTYERYLKEFYEQGYMKHGEMYLGDTPEEPSYRKYEGGGSQSVIDMQKMMQQMMPGIPGVQAATTQKQPKMMVLPLTPGNP